MDIFQVLGFTLITLVLLLVLRQTNPSASTLVGVVAGVTLLLLAVSQLRAIVGVFGDLAARAGVSQVYVATVLKVIGIAYLTEFGAQICRDAGEGALGSKVELAGKVLILVLAIPIVLAVLDTILKILP
ncbi:MAG: stage III sporulation protein AD [Bacillota bacterium]